jgi:hypothetical protein
MLSRISYFCISGLFNDAVSAQNIVSNDKIISESAAGHSVEVRSCTYLAEVSFRKITVGAVEITKCVGNDVVLICKFCFVGDRATSMFRVLP